MVRGKLLNKLQSIKFDLLIIGGGINGAVCAAAMSAAGFKVALIDQADFASMTSQESSNMIWGGIKYLESHQYALVRALCKSRNRLMTAYPTRVREITYYTSLFKGNTHGPLISFIGTQLYWLIGSLFTRPPSYKTPNMIQDELPIIKRTGLLGGVAYSDAYLPDNDARFTFQFILDAAARGAVTLNYIQALSCRRESGEWRILAQDSLSKARFTIKANVLLNACGPLLETFNQYSSLKTKNSIVYSKGVHLTVPRINGHDKILTFLSDDKRLFFVLPMGPVSCIGTTDTAVENYQCNVTDQDRFFILENINKRLALPSPLTLNDILAERCGVRTLVADGDENNWVNLSRKHVIEYDKNQQLINIIGGKLTNCLNIGEQVVELLAPNSPLNRVWFGEPNEAAHLKFKQQCSALHFSAHSVDGIDPPAQRLWRRYGNGAFKILDLIRADHTMMQEIIAETGILRAEIYYARDNEMIICLADFLRRRTNLALIRKHEDLRNALGMKELCQILFGEQAEMRQREYFS